MKRILYALILAIILTALIASPIAAAIPEPDSLPTVEEINIFQNILEPGDWLMINFINTPFATVPTIPVTETFSWSFRSNDTLDEFGSTIGFAFNENGYGFNVNSMYFSAAEVTALGLVFGDPYKLRLQPSPAHLPGMSAIDYDVTAGDYDVNVIQAAVRQAIADRVIELGTLLDVRWGTVPSVTALVEETEAARVLSVFGESFFRGAIFGLQAMAPAAFKSVITVVDVSARTFSTNYTDQVADQYAGTWIQTSREAGAALFGTSYDLLTVILMLIGVLGLIFGNVMLTGDSWNGIIDASVLAVFGARLGFYDFFFLLLITAVLWLYIGARIWFRVMR